MAISFDSIEGTLNELRRFLLDDLNLILAPGTGGNYAALLLVTAACEAVGRLRFGTGSGGKQFFGEYLLPDRWRAVGEDIYDSLRNGLAHAYETKMLVQLGGPPIEIGISRREQAHLSFDRARSRLYVNVVELSAALVRALDRYEGELRERADLRDTFLKWIEREVAVHVQDGRRRSAWRELLGLPEPLTS